MVGSTPALEEWLGAPPEGDFDPSAYGSRPIECYWYRFDDKPNFDEIGERHDCYFSNEGCWAELTML